METNYKPERQIVHEPKLPIFKPERQGNHRGNYRDKLPNALEWAKYWRRVRHCWLWYYWQWFEIVIIERWVGSHGWPWLFAQTGDFKYYFYLSYTDRHKMFYRNKAGEIYQYDFD